ncbi:hypothetical protein, partial [Fulvivirga aurantia]|uniref:hypothetical protein n=1 Tax=Fulvivirga aurantia TaxID=2529383 RepID=UPI001CA42B86
DLREKQEQPVVSVNFKRVLARVLKYWYLLVVSAIIALSIAHLVNRYATPIYPVTASIIIRESEENAGAKFLYDNS